MSNRTPWHQNADDPSQIDCEGATIVQPGAISWLPHAAFIVRAVNCHDELAAALENLVAAGHEDMSHYYKRIDEARAAMTLALPEGSKRAEPAGERAVAEFIVHAVSCHDELVASLEGTQVILRAAGATATLKDVTATLAKAKGGS